MSKYSAKLSVIIMTVILIAFPFVNDIQAAITFDDVNDKTVPDKETQRAIYELVDLYAIKGYPDGTYKPNKSISRAQVSVILTGALGLSLPENLDHALKQYSDIGPKHEYAVHIAATTVTGVFEGKNDSTFDPWSTITREEIAIVLGKILKDYNTEENVDVNLDDIGEDAKQYVQVIANLGVTSDLDNFRPHDEVTRAEFADFAFRTLTVIDENS